MRHFTSVRAMSMLAMLCAISAGSACRKTSESDKVPKAADSSASSAGETLWVTGNGLRLKTKIYRSANFGARPTLIVVLHGDSPFALPSYQYIFARKAAAELDNAVVVAILRPGYADDTGDRSDGERGLTTGDNYTAQDVDAIAQVIDQLKNKFHPAAAVLVGHSGGSAITGDILGRWPSAVNGALLVSCPCDLEPWRLHMMKMQANPMWLLPVKSISPMDVASKVSASVSVRLLVGRDDPIAPVHFSEEYAAALRSHGVNVTVTIAPGLKHDILLEPVAFQQLKALVEAMKTGA